MGVVYEAEDARLARKVALKFLPEPLANDPQALERFQREAKASSAFNHPNICTIHDIGEDHGRHYIVMERLYGKPLNLRIAARDLSVELAIELAIQIVDALDTAHSHRIVHRDLKPANVFVTTRGEAKVLDFGLAKTIPRRRAAFSMSAGETDGEFLTSPGSAVGTVAYMSPEQARGEDVDARSDIFSLGAVLYEMATGCLPFSGTTSAVLFDAILNRDPIAPSRLNERVSPEFEHIILKCLEKDREFRYQSAAELRTDLKRLRRNSQESSMQVKSAPAQAIRRPNLQLATIAVVAVLVSAGAVALWRWHEKPPTVAPQSQWTKVTDFNNPVSYPTLSPDGRMLAFIRGSDPFLTAGDVYLKMLPDGDPVQLTHDPSRKLAIAFSPDGSRVAYTGIDDQLSWNTYVVPVLGGQPQLLMPNAENLHWIDSHQLLFSEIDRGLHMMLVTSGEGRTAERTIYSPPTDRGMAHLSQLSPDGKQVLMTEMGPLGEWLPCRLVPFDGSSKGVQVGPAHAGCFNIGWSPDGKWMYLNVERNGYHLWRQRYPNGVPEQITFGPGEQLGLAVARDGHALFTTQSVSRSSLWLHRPGEEDREISLQGSASNPVFSPDGKTLFYTQLSNNLGLQNSGQLMAADLQTMQVSNLFPDVGVISFDISPDGKKIAMATAGKEGRVEVWWAPLDRRSAPRQILSSLQLDEPFFLSNDELGVRSLEEGKHYPSRVRLDGSELQKLFSDAIIDVGNVSPDRKWLVLDGVESDANGSAHTLVRSADGKQSFPLCSYCIVSWTPDQKTIMLQFPLAKNSPPIAIPTRRGPGVPPVPAGAGGYTSPEQALKVPGARRVEQFIQPSPVQGAYAYQKNNEERNIYRIPLQ